MKVRKALKPKVKFVIKTLENTYTEICYNFFKNDKHLDRVHAQAVAKHFGIDTNDLKGKTIEEKIEIVKEKVTPMFNDNLTLIEEKVKEYQALWDKYENKIHQCFKEIFNLKYVGERECLGCVNVNFVCPRYYDTWSFDIGINKVDIAALTTPIHELTHFFWYDLWKEVYPNWTKKDFCAPSVAWVFSELVIDSIFYNSGLKEITRFHPAYKYFYEIEYKGENLIEYFRQLYRENSIEDFMKKGYEFLTQNEELQPMLIR